MSRSSAIFKVSARRAAPTAAKMRGAPARIRNALAAEFRGHLKEELLSVGRQHAPVGPDSDTHLVDELDVNVGFRGGEVSVSLISPVRDPRTGYAYTPVTRFGHAGPIVARSRTPLKFIGDSGWVSPRQTAGYHPRRDWVERVESDMERVTARASRRLGRVMETLVL